MTAMTDKIRRNVELQVWMKEHGITIKATAKQLHWAYSTTRHNLMEAAAPYRHAQLVALGFPSDLLPPPMETQIPRFPGLENTPM